MRQGKPEFVVLLLLAALGAVLLAGANDVLLLAAAYLLTSVPLYAFVGFAKEAPGTEASLKFYLLGALLGTTMLFGVQEVSPCRKHAPEGRHHKSGRRYPLYAPADVDSRSHRDPKRGPTVSSHRASSMTCSNVSARAALSANWS